MLIVCSIDPKNMFIVTRQLQLEIQVANWAAPALAVLSGVLLLAE
jgi:hypothetical protein